MEYLSLGKIIDSFGLDGCLRVYSTTDQPQLRYKKGAKVFLYDELNDEHIEMTVESYRQSGKFDYIRLKEINSPEEAKNYKGFEIHTIKDRSILKVGYYFYSDLVGCKILDEQNNELGTVLKVEEFPAQITLRVKRQNKPDFFVPFIKQFIKNVDVETKEIHIIVMEGML